MTWPSHCKSSRKPWWIRSNLLNIRGRYGSMGYCTYRDTDFCSVTILRHQFERRGKGKLRSQATEIKMIHREVAQQLTVSFASPSPWSMPTGMPAQHGERSVRCLPRARWSLWLNRHRWWHPRSGVLAGKKTHEAKSWCKLKASLLPATQMESIAL